ncbi:uncharacterized protein LOC6580107 [Drosophila mojavensis]|uniref:HMG box domain-containing protein n=1 Tax=Drosophila mojavensis TaxID=7230 RepID=B4KMY8_DROMO|nr:uncharacterized protein LOC6580107 [Drosophila mojavensis]EDW09910.1 uncharacterized protein Dmoj_GI18801 [Drosophila mojavensis]
MVRGDSEPKKRPTKCCGKTHMLLNTLCKDKAFLMFLTHFRRNEKVKEYNMTKSQCLTIAAKVWNRMSDVEKLPYIHEARNFKYVFKSNNNCLNWAVKQVRQILVADGQLYLQRLWQLASKLTAWNDRVIDNIPALDGKKQ